MEYTIFKSLKRNKPNCVLRKLPPILGRQRNWTKLMIKKLFLNDIFILGLILINAIILFAGGYLTLENHKLIFLFADNLLTSLFIVELIIKLKEFGLKNYFSSNWHKKKTLHFSNFVVSFLKKDVTFFQKRSVCFFATVMHNKTS